MGLVMTDIKRVIAYSTLNSLGLMMVALGFGEAGVGPAMLYLFSHAFFKALLFLAAGSVIHATEQQERSPGLGGLASKMPLRVEHSPLVRWPWPVWCRYPLLCQGRNTRRCG